MADLDRFFRQIVRNLAATDPARLHRPLPLSELRETIVPYRANRRALELESAEDYELVLMRLCAGEGGFARTEPAEVRAEFEVEVGSSNPDLEIVQRHGNAVVSLESKPLALALNHQPGLAFAPPDAPGRPVVREEPSIGLPELPARETLDEVDLAGATGHAALRCGLCDRGLPTGRVVNFCPHCGASQGMPRCPACRSETEAGWRHCVGCGAALSRS
ncbi:MAG: zinc ribbon domain-containing protein [Gemmatimonadales bacterium]